MKKVLSGGSEQSDVRSRILVQWLRTRPVVSESRRQEIHRYLGRFRIDSITDGRAGVFADFDNDGDLDVFSTTIQHQAHLLFRNNVGQDSNFVRIELEGTGRSTRDAFGSVVRVKTSAGMLTKIKSAEQDSSRSMIAADIWTRQRSEGRIG